MIGSLRRATVIACVTAFPFARFVHHRVAQVLGARASEPPDARFLLQGRSSDLAERHSGPTIDTRSDWWSEGNVGRSVPESGAVIGGFSWPADSDAGRRG